MKNKNKPPIQFQVQQISNGFIVAFPGATMINPENGKQMTFPGHQHYVKDYDELVGYLKEVFDDSGIELYTGPSLEP